MKQTVLISLFLVLLVGQNALAQNYKFEVSLRGSWLFARASGTNPGEAEYYGLPTLEINYFVIPKVSVGIFYTHSISDALGDYSEDDDLYYLNLPDGDALYQHYGLAIQLSTNRTSRFRLYMSAGIFRAEEVVNFGDFKSARSGLGYTGGLGTAIRITRSLSFNLFDARAILYSEDFSYHPSVSTIGVKVDTGFIFKFMRER